MADRYSALGIPGPDPATVCRGPCEGTGFVPVREDDTEYGDDWKLAEAKSATDDGWHFVACHACKGTGRRPGKGNVWGNPT